jgi:cytochrome c oxidase subunit 4
MSSHVVSVRTNITVFAALLILLAATVAAAYLPLRPLHLPIALGIAATKALLIGLFFMHLRHRSRLTPIVATASLFWLGILLTFTLSDYLTRR